MEKTILLCGNGLSGEAIYSIKEWGYKVALISEFPHDRGVEKVDYFIEADSKNPESAVSAALKLKQNNVKIDGVISLCWDSAVSVASIANELNLLGISIESALSATQKDIRSEAFKKYRIPSPRYFIVDSYDSLLEVVAQYEYPLILKPINQSSSKGVVKVSHADELEAAYKYAQSYTNDTKILVNEFLEGSEHSTEGLMVDGKFYLTAISDRVFDYKKYAPYFVETGDIMPSTLNQDIQVLLSKVTQDAALALNIKQGVVKGDILYSKSRGVFVLEIAARLGGPRFGTEMVPLSNGTNILKAAIQQAVGEKVDIELLKPKFSKGMVNRSLFPSPGIICQVSGIDVLPGMEGFYDFKWWGKELKVNDEILPYRHGCGGVAYFIACGQTREDAIEKADNIEKTIIIKTQREKII